MAHRQEEKQRRREERLERERAEAAAAARRTRLQWAAGAVLAIAILAGVVVFAVAGMGGGGGGAGKASAASSAAGDVSLPQQQTSDVNVAAKAAGCVLQHPPIEGSTHEARQFKPSDYKTNPPTSGNHNPEYYSDGIYAPGDVPRLGMLVHPLEHGRIEIQYRPGTPAQTVTQLEALVAEQSNGYHMILTQNTTGMTYAVAATAWGQLLGCSKMSPKVFDAMRTFRERYIDKGPEAVP